MAMKKSKENMTPETALAIAMALNRADSSGLQAAIAMALEQYLDGTVHDNESFVITIGRGRSDWSSKLLTLRQLPARK